MSKKVFSWVVDDTFLEFQFWAIVRFMLVGTLWRGKMFKKATNMSIDICVVQYGFDLPRILEGKNVQICLILEVGWTSIFSLQNEISCEIGMAFL